MTLQRVCAAPSTFSVVHKRPKSKTHSLRLKYFRRLHVITVQRRPLSRWAPDRIVYFYVEIYWGLLRETSYRTTIFNTNTKVRKKFFKFRNIDFFNWLTIASLKAVCFNICIPLFFPYLQKLRNYDVYEPNILYWIVLDTSFAQRASLERLWITSAEGLKFRIRRQGERFKRAPPPL